MKRTMPRLFFVLLLAGCDIQAIDYAVGDVKLIEKTQVEVGNQPAIRLVIENGSEQDVSDIVVTIKAKKEQLDLEEVRAKVDFLKSGERAEREAIFKHIPSHSEYEFLTFAVTFTTVKQKDSE